MIHTVLMPFNRPQNFEVLREHMEGQNVEWVPLYDSDECHEIFAERVRAWVDWIKPWRGDLPKKDGKPTVNPGHWMTDAFLDSMTPDWFSADRFVSFMTDDCLWCWNHWRKLQSHFVKRNRGGNEYSPAVVMCATMLQNNIIYPAHRREGELFHVSTCRTFCTRYEALTVRADKLKDVRFGKFWAGDGIVVERLVEENWANSGVEFAPEAVVYFNALCPEQWGFPHHKI